MNPKPVRILIVEDIGLVAELLTEWCNRTFTSNPRVIREGEEESSVGNLEAICRWVPSVQRAHEVMREGPPDLALIDIHLPDGSGFELAEAWSSTYPRLRMLGFSALRDARTVEQIGASPMHGFVSKSPGGLKELPHALREVLAGRRYFCSAVQELRLRVTRDPNYFGHSVSARERAVLYLVTQGLDDREIAEQLAIAESTARKHRKNLMQKLDVPSSARLVAKGWKLGFGDTRSAAINLTGL